MPRYTIRELLLVTLGVAIALGWWIDHWRLVQAMEADPFDANFHQSLVREIKAWKQGDRPPARLLKFPDGKIDVLSPCGVIAEAQSVGYYLRAEVSDAELLVAIIFDQQAEPESAQSAISRLIELKGVNHLARLVEERRRTDPADLTAAPLAILAQLLESPYLAIQVARISPDDMLQQEAEAALGAMKTDLEAGQTWGAAYRKHSDLHPDLRELGRDGKPTRTLIAYRFSGTVSPGGFDLTTYTSPAENLPADRLHQLFRAKHGAHIFSAPDGIYLYQIEDFFPGLALGAAPE